MEFLLQEMRNSFGNCVVQIVLEVDVVQNYMRPRDGALCSVTM